MAQNSIVTLNVKRYTRADFNALRAILNKIPASTVLDLYYPSEDDRELLGLHNADDLRRHIDVMRDYLIQRLSETRPDVSRILEDARRITVWSSRAIDYLVHAADESIQAPRPSDPLSLWFRGPLAANLKAEGCKTLEDLGRMMNARGANWWMPVPRLGAKKAAVIVKWFKDRRSVADLVDDKSLVPAQVRSDMVLLEPACPTMVPIERMRLPHYLSGETGDNRCQTFCQISARDDLGAVGAYLIKHRDNVKTSRAYQKELERFLLWCVYERRKPLSSILTDDCERYKDFLRGLPEIPAGSARIRSRAENSLPMTANKGFVAPTIQASSMWVGPRATRLSAKWKPFAGRPSPASCKYAFVVLKTFFTWLVNVRYLSGNPWLTVSPPVVEKEELPLQIDKALPGDLWQKLAGTDGILDYLCSLSDAELQTKYRPRGWAARFPLSQQFRLSRATILLLGETGIRREEATLATRDRLMPLRGNNALWELSVTGKGRKRRTVFVPVRAVAALREHWADRKQDFDFSLAGIPLLSPVVIPETPAAKKRHYYDQGERKAEPFSPDSLGRLVATSLLRISRDPDLDLEEGERTILAATAAHAFRHTWATLSIADEVPLDVVQRAMGHASLDTTTIYVRAERQRSIAELTKMHAKRNGGNE